MNIAIVGGGFTGLAAAKKLLEDGHKVDLFEKSERLGGVASSIPYENTRLEIFYHHIFTSDNDIIDLIAELGLKDRLHWLESKMGFFVDGSIFPFGTPTSLLKFKPLSYFDKFRFGLSILKLQSIKDWSQLEGVTAKDWLVKYAGYNAYKVCWEPLLRTKFGEKYDRISMAWFWGKIKLRGSTRSEAKTKEMLGYMKGSFEVLGDRLIEYIKQRGADIRLSSNVENVSLVHGRPTLQVNGSLIGYDKILLTVPLPIIPALVKGLPQSYIDRVSKIEYTAVICAILKMKRSFSDMYWMNIGDTTIPFGGLIEHTNMIHDPDYNDKKIMYISNYTFVDDPLYHASDDEIMKEYTIHLQKINPEFNESWLEDVHIFRSPYAQPIIECHYSTIKPSFQTPLEGIYLANMTHIYPEDRGMNYAVRTGYQVAQAILAK